MPLEQLNQLLPEMCIWLPCACRLHELWLACLPQTQWHVHGLPCPDWTGLDRACSGYRLHDGACARQHGCLLLHQPCLA